MSARFLALLAALIAAGASAEAATVLSSASIASAALTVSGTRVPLGTVGAAGGNSAGGPYSVTTTLPAISQRWTLPGRNTKVTLTLDAANAVATAAGTSKSPANAAAAVSVGTVALALVPSAGGTPYVTVMLSGAQSSASYIPDGSDQGTAFGGSTLGTVTVTGTLLQGQTITRDLNVEPNTVVFDQNGVKLTLRGTAPLKPTLCGSSCASLPYGISSDTVSLTLTNVPVNGKTVSGTLTLGHAEAN